MSAFTTGNNLIPAAVAVLNVGLYAYGFVDAVQRGDWLAAAGYGTALCVLYVFFRWWRRARRAWWWSPEYQARHADFVDRLTRLTSDPYTAWNIHTRQWIAVIAHTPPWAKPCSGRRYYEVLVEDSPEPSFVPGQATEFDFVTTRCYGVYRNNPRVDIDVTVDLVDPHTGYRHPMTDAEQDLSLRALLRRLRTPAAARLACTTDIDALLELLDEAEPRERR
ncbi:hypothetical protein [Nocardia salmonicida]|uniref:hypothetical protein n=1 Tax=Nocardia salmonicida TaxID=53431 RepID=UPI0007A4BA51|nr:hypothetical protein [Nocardia salmonicida]